MEAYVELEHRFREYVGWGYPVACNSGTAALHLALESLELPLGSQVIVPEFTMVACARAVILAGLQPVFVDCDDNGLMDLDTIHRYITHRTSAIMLVHIYGRSTPRSVINKLHDHVGHRIAIIEDWAEHTKPAPTDGLEQWIDSDVLCWSFYKNKIIHGEEGGMVLFKGRSKANLAKSLRCQGFTEDHDFKHNPRGCNYRMPNALAKPILSSLAAVDSNLAYRKQLEELYNSIIPTELQQPLRESPWVYDLRLPPLVDAFIITRKLNEQDVPARQSFKPMSMQPEFMGHYEHLNAYRLSRELIYLPMSDTTNFTEVERNARLLLSLLS